MADTQTKVRDILVSLLGVEPAKVTDTANLVDDLGADSLDVIEIAMVFEDDFGIEIPNEDIRKFVTVGDVVAYLGQRVAA